MTLTLDDDILATAGITNQELLIEIAATLYHRKGLPLGKASALAGLNRIVFLEELAAREIPIHYNEQELDRDIKTLGL